MIVADGLTKRFGTKIAVDDVSFEVEPGQILGFIGHNGAGKTTTLRMLVGHARADGGTSTILGKPFGELEHPLSRVGVMLEPGAHPGRSGRNHLKMCAAVGGVTAKRVDLLLELVGLADAADRRVGGYSQGMRQRLGLATALLADPDVLILDEPGNGLDPEGIRWMRALLRRLADQGRTILLSSHQLGEVAQTVDDVVVIDRGTIVAESTLGEMLREAGSEVVVRSPGAEVLAVELRRAGISADVVSAQELHARNVPSRVVSELASVAGVPVWELRTVHPSLEEVFFDLTRGDNGGPATQDSEAEADAGPDDGAASAGEDPDAVEERRLDRDLSRQPTPSTGRVVAVVAPDGGLGCTTLSFLLGDVLARALAVRVLAAALSCDRERMCLPVPRDERSSLGLAELLQDLPDFDEAARLTPYVSAANSGLHTLCGPRRPETLARTTPAQVESLLRLTTSFYELVVVDAGGLKEPALRGLLRRADQVVLLGAPGAQPDEGSMVLQALEAERSERATLVLNRVDEDAMASFAARRGQGPFALVPSDRELIRAMDAGDFRLEQVQPATRVALKRVALTVAEGLR